MKRWVVTAKRADFDALGKQFGISPMLARIIRNRDMETPEEIGAFLNGTPDDLHDPMLLHGMDMAVALIKGAIEGEGRIRVIGDYDADGICATYILVTALRLCGADVSWQLPDRIKDGYGLNRDIITKANEDQIAMILTCDNGIAAVEEIAYAKELGMCVVVTDHHEPPEVLPAADVIIDPKQKDCSYPDPEICGAVVACKLVQALCRELHVRQPEDHLQFAAFATVCDVMPLLRENRIIVKYGLEAIKKTKNIGMEALLNVTGCDRNHLSPYHIGFILGPCVNATGRLDLAERALSLFLAQDEREAVQTARALQQLNEDRKSMTLRCTEQAIRIVQTGDENNPVMADDKVLVVYLPDCHESIAGIVAGKVRERYYKPVIVLTRAGDEEENGDKKAEDAGQKIAKGSARSIEAYNMYEALRAFDNLFIKFGGHKMAAGMSLQEENIGALRKGLNEAADLSEEDLTEKVKIDIAMPMRYATGQFVTELERLSPYGNGNPKPLFAQKGLTISELTVQGKNRNVVKLSFAGESAKGVWFGDGNAFEKEYAAGDTVSVVYTPEFNEFRGQVSIQMQIKEIKPDT